MKARMLRKLTRRLAACPTDARARALFLRDLRCDELRRGRGTVRLQRCRVDALYESSEDDEIMHDSGCMGDFAADARRRDLRDGCPFCIEGCMP